MTDLRRALDVVDPDRMSAAGEPLPWELLHGLVELVRADGIAYLEQDPYERRQLLSQDTETGVERDAEADLFWSLYWTSPCSYPQRSGDFVRIRHSTDELSARQWRATPMAACLLQIGVKHELVVPLPPAGTLDRRLLLYRHAGAAFRDDDVLLLTLLRPHIVALHERAVVRAGAPPEVTLTQRQRQLLQLVAVGYSNGQIARRLQVSEGTVRKHLENTYARLEVTNRTAAIARAFSVA